MCAALRANETETTRASARFRASNTSSRPRLFHREAMHGDVIDDRGSGVVGVRPVDVGAPRRSSGRPPRDRARAGRFAISRQCCSAPPADLGAVALYDVGDAHYNSVACGLELVHGAPQLGKTVLQVVELLYDDLGQDRERASSPRARGAGPDHAARPYAGSRPGRRSGGRNDRPGPGSRSDHAVLEAECGDGVQSGVEIGIDERKRPRWATRRWEHPRSRTQCSGHGSGEPVQNGRGG